MKSIVAELRQLVTREVGAARRFCAAAVSITFLLLTGCTTPQATEGGNSGEIQELTEALSSRLADLQDDIDGIATKLDVQVSVNTAFCESVPVQCQGGSYERAYGWTASASGPVGNQSPIKLTMLVSHNGVPVTRLTLEEIAIDIDIIPAGGVFVGICEEATVGRRCVRNFFEFDSGQYSMLLDPLIDEAYKAGGYSGLVLVNYDSNGRTYHGAALVTWEIPPGPPDD